MNKVVIGIVAILFVAVAGIGVYLVQNLDGIVKDLIEQAGTESTGTPIRVAAVKINLQEGTATISGLTVANPAGFSAEPLLRMDNIAVSIDTSSLTRAVIVINNIGVVGMHVLAEQKGTTTNVQSLMDAMESADSNNGGSSAGEDAEIEMAIARISFSENTMELRSEQLGSRSVKLSDMNFRQLGTQDNGLTPDEVAAELSTQLLGQVQDAVKSALQKYLAEEAETQLKGKLKEKLGSLFSRDE